MANTYEPKWAEFSRISNEILKNNIDNKKIQDFWSKRDKLMGDGIMCSCGNNECTPEGNCTKCFLEIDNPEWRWEYPRKEGGRWLCYNKELATNMKNYKPLDGSSWGYIMATNRGNIWETTRWYFYNKQNKKCAECGEEFEINDMDLHHINEKINGGRETEDNLQMLCQVCHRTHALSMYDYAI